MKISSFECVVYNDKYGAIDSDSKARLKDLFTTILNIYNWDSRSEIVTNTPENTDFEGTGLPFYLKLYVPGADWHLELSVGSEYNGSWWTLKWIIRLYNESGVQTDTIYNYRAYNYGNSRSCISIGETSKGLAMAFKSRYAGSSNDGDFNPYDFTLYIGDYTTLEGTVKKGIVLNGYGYTNNQFWCYNGNTGETDSGFSSNISNANKAYLAPVVNTQTGDVFNDIYMMLSSPVQYNNLKIASTNKLYMCGRNLCIAD